MTSITRRDVLRLAAAAAAAPLVPRATLAETGKAPVLAAGRFFDAPEMALLDELAEMIIPQDEHSGGARAAGVAAYIDGRLAEYDPAIPDLREERLKWKAGLALVDALAREVSAPFLEASPAQRIAVLERLAAGEEDPQDRRRALLRGAEATGRRSATTPRASASTTRWSTRATRSWRSSAARIPPRCPPSLSPGSRGRESHETQRILLVRHGESAGNVDKRVYATIPDYALPLTRRGHKQTKQLGKEIRRLIGKESIHFYVSPCAAPAKPSWAPSAP